MRYNPASLFSLEAIDYQNDSYFQELTGYFTQYKEQKIKQKDFETIINKSIKRRFNINVDFKVVKSSTWNAYMIPIELDPANVLSFRRFGGSMGEYIAKAVARENHKLMERIAKGDLSPIGVMDYKKAKVGGLFAELPAATSVMYSALLESVKPEEAAGILLHEIGHYWTWLEFLGVYTCRNAIIANNVNELLGVKTKEERIAILTAEDNYWNLEMNPEKLAQLKDEDLVKVYTGIMSRKYLHDKGYVQYDDNTSEVIADQFAIRMGAPATAVSMGLHGVLVKYGLHKQRTNSDRGFWALSLMGIGGIVAGGIGLLLGAFFAPVALQIGVMTTIYNIVTIFNEKENNGSAYDNTFDRYRRMYNDEVGRLKQTDLPPDIMKRVLGSLTTINNVMKEVEQTHGSMSDKIMMWFSSSYRDQRSRKLYQNMVEELLANNLFVTAAKFKTL